MKPHSPELHAAAALEGKHETREQMRSRRTIEHADEIRAVTAFAAQHGLQVVTAEPERRLVRLSGSVAQFSQAFSVNLGIYDTGQGEFRSYSGTLSVPARLAPSIESILGLDKRPVARSLVRSQDSPAEPIGYLPNVVADLYGFPDRVNGQDQCVGIIELAGGYYNSDITTAFQAMSLPPPTVLAVGVNGGANNPGVVYKDDEEVALDIQVAGGAAPGALMAVYFAPGKDADSFVLTVSAAAHDKNNSPSVISISWGGPEKKWTQPEMNSMNSALMDAAGLGISVFVASGDDFATDGEADGRAHVDFPAASPWAIGCGGTSMAAIGSTIEAEVVWNHPPYGTGGGISDVAPVPSFQAHTALPPSVNDGGYRRGVPDVAGSADQGIGYVLVVYGQKRIVGGTSGVAPLWAGLTARLDQLLPKGQRLGFFLTDLYDWAWAGPTRDITVGNNRPPGQPNLGYDAGPGWDACTGWGSPDGNRLALILARKVKSLGSVSAIAWFDTTLQIRLFGPDQWYQIQEYRYNHGWTVGGTLPVVGQSGQLTAMSWQDYDSLQLHVRLYYQDGQDTIQEQSWDGESWHPGNSWPGAAPGCGLAAVWWNDSDGLHLRLFYQDSSGNIVEQCWDGEGWHPGNSWPATVPVSGLTVIRWKDSDGVHLRLYYQDSGGNIVEQCWDGYWHPGNTLPATAPGSGLAAVVWNDTSGVYVRLYYQDPQNIVQEYIWDGTWHAGATLPAASLGSKLAAVQWVVNGTFHLRVYCNTVGGALRESAYDGHEWYSGQLIVPAG